MEFITEKFIDFESLKVNGIDIKDLFYDQQWGNYFEMLNGFVYFDIVKNFWNKAYVFDKVDADEEVRKMVENDNSLIGKTRVQLGLRPFKGKEIRSNLLGVDVLITQEHVAKILGMDNEGEKINLSKSNSKYVDSIKKDLFPAGTRESEFGRAKFMKKEFNIAFNVFLASIVTRDGGKDTISWAHRHFLWFMHKRVKINLADTLFEQLCLCISESHHKAKVTIHHPRLISEIFRQSKLIEVLKTHEKLRVFMTAKFDGSTLVHMKMIKPKDLKKPVNPLQKIYEKYFWCDGFPTISEHGNDEVIKNFQQMEKDETGAKVDRRMVVAVPDWDVFNNPKERSRSFKKPVVFEEPAEEEDADNENQEQDNNDEYDSIDDMIDNPENVRAAQEEVGTSERQEVRAAEKVDPVEKERRSKKRNERSPSTEGEKVVPAKRTKTVAPRRTKKAAIKGKVSKPNTKSISKAQDQPPPGTTIDYTKPIRMIVPTQTVEISSSSSSSDSVSSSSEETVSDSSQEKISTLLKRGPQLNPKSKPTSKPQSYKTPIVKEFVSEGNSVLDHLVSHISGDAFTTFNLNSPNHPINKFLSDPHITNADPEPETHYNIPSPPPPKSLEVFFQASPMHYVAPEQDNSITISELNPTPIQTSFPEQQALHSEITQPELTHIPTSEQCDDIPSDNHEHHIPQTSIHAETLNTPPSPYPSSSIPFGPAYKPLTLDEIIIPSDQMLPLMENIIMQSVDIDESLEPPSLYPKINIHNIKIKPLKRKKPEPTIPFNRTQPFFNTQS
ncbi:hypothetical protein QL285_093494 [Trifolium repens]|nr:hypothetical protein QL285_093494 [Trifolium repens]